MSHQKRYDQALDQLQKAVQNFLDVTGDGTPKLAQDWFLVVQSHRMTEQREPGTRYDIMHSPMAPHALDGIISIGRHLARNHIDSGTT